MSRLEHEAVLEDMQSRLDQASEMMRIRRQTVEQPFGTLKAWMGAAHFLTRALDRVSREMSLHVLAYNFKRLLSPAGQECADSRDEGLKPSPQPAKAALAQISSMTQIDTPEAHGAPGRR